ncbi:MAG: hypothetical protein LBH41_00820 [Rickettsiales bacterium]|jgi:hypothetical protein|nr:hypothetical protein [Rickettsiales bacterium]
MKQKFWERWLSKRVFNDPDALSEMMADDKRLRLDNEALAGRLAEADKNVKSLSDRLDGANKNVRSLSERLMEKDYEFLESGKASANTVYQSGERRKEAFNPQSGKWENMDIDYDTILGDTIKKNCAPDEYIEIPHGSVINSSPYGHPINFALFFAGRLPPKKHAKDNYNFALPEEIKPLVLGDGVVFEYATSSVRALDHKGREQYRQLESFFDGKSLFFIYDPDQGDQSKSKRSKIIKQIQYATNECVEQRSQYSEHSWGTSEIFGNCTFADPELQEKFDNLRRKEVITLSVQNKEAAAAAIAASRPR